MPKIPAFCNRCGEACLSQVSIKDATLHIHDHEEGPCSCGGTFILLDGTYTHLGGPINLCNASEDAIARFKEALKRLGQ